MSQHAGEKAVAQLGDAAAVGVVTLVRGEQVRPAVDRPSDMLKCAPPPVRSRQGLGINVAS
jgi:hypothetical protein